MRTQQELMELAAERAVRRIRISLGKIVGAIIEKAREGSVQHAKLLLDWAAISPYVRCEEEGEQGGSELARVMQDAIDSSNAESDEAGEEVAV